MRRFQLPVYKFAHEGKWVVINDRELQSIQQTAPDEYEHWDTVLYEHQQCPIKDFLPHGAKNASKWGNDGLCCMNDWNHDLLLVLAGNQLGKSTIGIAFCLLHGLIPLDPEWSCFKDNRIEYHEWTGPKILIVGSYSWDNIVDLHAKYLSWLPRKEIPQYAPNWGYFEGEKKRQKEISFGNNVSKSIKLACGSQIIYLCYTQRLSHWAGRQCDIHHADEQEPEDKFDELTARQLTRESGYTPIIMTLTGHIMPDRPDTGAQGWIKTQLIDRSMTKGRKFKEYHLSIESTPKELVSMEARKRAYIQWVKEPEETNNFRKKCEGEARYWGSWQRGGGLFIGDWSSVVHVVEPFDMKIFKPTIYRMIDHGQDPCAALCVARLPTGDSVVFSEYYEYGRNIEKNAAGIVEEMCHNRRSLIDSWQEDGRIWSTYAEEFVEMEFAGSELDGVSWGAKVPESRRTIGTLYNQFGCTCSPARADKDTILYPLMREMFALDPKRKHLNYYLNRNIPKDAEKYGSPHIYIFSTMKNTIQEIESLVEDPVTMKPKKTCKDHLVSCLKFYAARERLYLGPCRT